MIISHYKSLLKTYSAFHSTMKVLLTPCSCALKPLNLTKNSCLLVYLLSVDQNHVEWLNILCSKNILKLPGDWRDNHRCRNTVTIKKIWQCTCNKKNFCLYSVKIFFGVLSIPRKYTSYFFHNIKLLLSFW